MGTIQLAEFHADRHAWSPSRCLYSQQACALNETPFANCHAKSPSLKPVRKLVIRGSHVIFELQWWRKRVLPHCARLLIASARACDSVKASIETFALQQCLTREDRISHGKAGVGEIVSLQSEHSDALLFELRIAAKVWRVDTVFGSWVVKPSLGSRVRLEVVKKDIRKWSE